MTVKIEKHVNNNGIMEVLRCGHLLVSTREYSSVVRLIIQKICDVFHAETSSLMLIDDKTGDLVFQVALGKAERVIKSIRIPVGEGLAGHVALTGKPLLVKNVKNDGRHFSDIDKKANFQTKSMMVVPLKISNKVAGVIEVINSKNSEGFTYTDLELLTLLAPFATTAIENARYSGLLENMVAQRTRELETSNERLRKIDSSKTEFLSNIAHELRTPLSAMRLLLSLLNDGSLGEINAKQSEVTNDCRSAIDRLLRLIESLLDMAKIEAGVVDFHFSRLSIFEQTESALRILEPHAREKSITFKCFCDNAFVKADSDKLQQVLLNLIGNAIKYSPSDSEITIKTYQSDCFVHFSVSDRGPGISTAQIKTLFTRFGRIIEDKSPSIAGTGLGLVISRNLIEKQGGKLSVSSKPGKGSVFKFTLPVWNIDNTITNHININSGGVQ